MRHPIIGDNWAKRLARTYISFAESWFIKNIARPILFILPPTIATAAATRQGLQEEIANILPPKAASFINESALIILVGVYLYVVIAKAIHAYIKNYSKPAKEISVEDVIAINKSIEIVVTEKYKRLSQEARKTKATETLNPGAVFRNITLPETQIKLTINGIRSVFEHLDQTRSLLRVGLIRIIDNKPTEWIAFEPMSHPPRTSAPQLSAPSSTVSATLKTKSIVVVEDIQAELSVKTKDKRRFLALNTQPTDQGSQLCYPIIHASTGKIEYIITIASNKKLSLQTSHKELYTWILEQFALRIALEHSLLLLKEKAHEESAA